MEVSTPSGRSVRSGSDRASNSYPSIILIDDQGVNSSRVPDRSDQGAQTHEDLGFARDRRCGLKKRFQNPRFMRVFRIASYLILGFECDLIDEPTPAAFDLRPFGRESNAPNRSFLDPAKEPTRCDRFSP